ncbi:unnamed protein product, partial [Iphiclides podalirius]
MEAVSKNQLPQGGTGDAGESTPRHSLGSPIVSGGGGGQHTALRRRNCVVGGSCNIRRPRDLAGGGECESDGSQISLTSANSQDTRKRKATKIPSTENMAAKYKAVAISASATGTEEEMMETEMETEEDFLDPSVPPSKTRAKKKLPNPDELLLDLQSQPSGNIEEHIDLQLQTIEKVADHSRNLKGNFVRGLRLAVRNVKAAAAERARRSITDANVIRLEKENAELGSQLSSLASKLEKLTEEINLLRRQNRVSGETSASLTQKSPNDTMKMGEEKGLLERIGVLIESKKADFEAKLFPDRALRPTLGARPKITSLANECSDIDPRELQPQPPSLTQSQKRNKKKKAKKKKSSPPPVTDLPPIAAPYVHSEVIKILIFAHVLGVGSISPNLGYLVSQRGRGCVPLGDPVPPHQD